MKITILKSKIHKAKITFSDLNYEGSISVDKTLLKAAGMKQYEKVMVVNLNNGNRWETYIIEAPENSGEIGLNGAGARLGMVGDTIIIFTFGMIDENEYNNYKPKIVILDKNNQIISA